MLSKHFPSGTELHKILNKNNVKISYCTTQNMKSIVDSHNRKILAGKKHEDNQGLCNCLKSRKDNCPLQGKCLTKSLCTELTSLTQPPMKPTLTLDNAWGPSKTHPSQLLRRKKPTAAPQWPSGSRLRKRSRSLSLLPMSGSWRRATDLSPSSGTFRKEHSLTQMVQKVVTSALGKNSTSYLVIHLLP